MAFYKLVAGTVNATYRLFRSLFQERENSVAIVSRQSDAPFDLMLLKDALEERVPDVRIDMCCHKDRQTVGILLHQLLLMATCDVVLVDGYVPAVSLPRKHDNKIIQVWHALGAIKKFGYQSVGTPDGRSDEQATELRMHRNYDVIVAGLSGAVPAFSAGFGYGDGVFAPIGLPRCDYLLSPSFEEMRRERLDEVRDRFGVSPDDGYVDVLYAPTFRRNDDKWFAEAIRRLSRRISETKCGDKRLRLVVSGHPIQHDDGSGDGAYGNTVIVSGVETVHLLHAVDYVVTDYSTIAFEAALIDKPVLFYAPDIEAYRKSPGLNIDPEKEFGGCCWRDEGGVIEACAMDASGERKYDDSEFRRFFDAYAENLKGLYERSESGTPCIDALVDIVNGSLTNRVS